MSNFDKLIEQLSSLDSAHLGSLISSLENKWHMCATPVISIPNVIVAKQAEAEPTEFTASLVAFTSKMGVIKALRDITSMGLLQAKEFIEGTLPREIKTGLSADDAEELKRKFTETGSTIEITPV